tara:strand:+ start:672 stop:1706 length:1035 start_codon:yes stop_codon:yes gene_type:complete
MDKHKSTTKGAEGCIELTILPVSGGHFVNQIALISLLCDKGYRPKLILGSSGGAISAYIGLCADWKYNGILRVLEDISSELFVKSWWGNKLGPYIPSGIIGIFKGALFKHGSGAEHLFDKYLTTDSVTRCEIWCGTYNKDTGTAGMFCNRSYEKSYVKSGDSNPPMPTTINYLDGDLEKISKSVYASSCIPTLLPSIEIDGEKYYDGGLVSASPLFPLSDCLPDCLKIIYISSFDMEKEKADLVDCSNIIQIGIGSIAETVTGLCMADRIFAVRLAMKCTKVHYVYLEDIDEACMIYRNAEKAVMELFPLVDQQVNITKFDHIEAIKSINIIRQNYGIRLWWSE